MSFPDDCHSGELHVSPDIDPNHPALDAFWESRVAEDAIWYGHLAAPGAWFFDRHSGRYYQNVLPETVGGEVRLEAATTHTVTDKENDPSADRRPVQDVHCVSTVSQLAGAIEAGDLVHISQGQPLVDGETVAVATENAIQHSPRTAFGGDGGSWAEAGYELSSLPTQALYQVSSGDNHSETDGDVLRADEDHSVDVRYVATTETSRWTFKVDTYRRWVEHHLPPESEVLNLCCGRSRLYHDGNIVRVDAEEDIDSDITCDVAEVAAHLDDPANRFDAAVIDPPWSAYQSNLRYQGNHVWAKSPSDSRSYGSANTTPIDTKIDLSALPFEVDIGEKSQLGHAKLMKNNIDHVLRPGGKVIQLSQHGTLMPADWEYKRAERVCFDPIGEARVVIGAVDRKTQTSLSQF